MSHVTKTRLTGVGRGAIVAIALPAFAFGCGGEIPAGQWRPGSADNTPEHPIQGDFQPPKLPYMMEVHRDKPPRPYVELGIIDIPCRSEAKTELPVFVGPVTTQVEGGCALGEAVSMAKDRAAGMRADGIFGLQISGLSSGKVALLIATAFRYSPSASAPASASAAAAPSPASSTPAPLRGDIAERLERLRQLRDAGTITAEDYERRKAEILREL